MIDLEKFKNLKGYENFDQASHDVMEMASQILGSRTYFVTHSSPQTLSVLSVKANERVDIPAGLMLPLDDSY